MKIAYLDTAVGISGDMTVSALIEAGVSVDALRDVVNSLGIDGVELEVSKVIKMGFSSTHFVVKHPPQHAHRHMSDIRDILDRGKLTPRQKAMALAIFGEIAIAEAKVHGTTVDHVHFHEVGAIDSIVDIVCAAVGFDLLGVEKIYCSPIPTGYGRIKIDHGVCSIPAPATAEILKGIPLVDVRVEGELTTPTGAAIVKALVSQFCPMPAMKISSIGYGAGTKNWPDRANVLRLLVGEAAVARSSGDQVWLLETNLDDISGEVLGYTQERLFEAGALDVYTTPIAMKKGRPGVILSVIGRLDDGASLEEIIFRETKTLGIRRQIIDRATQSRAKGKVATKWGKVDVKISWSNDHAPVVTPEYDSCRELARSSSVPLHEIYAAVTTAAQGLSLEQLGIKQKPKSSDHSHDHSHSYSHDHSHDHGHSHDHSHSHDKDRSHDHSHSHDHGKGHQHDHDHGKGHRHDH